MMGMIQPTPLGGPAEMPGADAAKPESDGSDDFASVLALAWSAPNGQPQTAPKTATSGGTVDHVEPAGQGGSSGPKSDALAITAETPLVYSTPDDGVVTAASETMSADAPIALDPLTQMPTPDRPPVDPFHISANLMTPVVPTTAAAPQVKNPKLNTPSAETPAAPLGLGTVVPETTPVEPVTPSQVRAGRRPADDARRVAGPDREIERRADAPRPKNDDPKHVSHERVEVVSKPREARRPAVETHPVHALLSEARRPVASINASTLKPLFDGKPLDPDSTRPAPTVEAVDATVAPAGPTHDAASVAQNAPVPAQTASAMLSQTADAVISMAERVARHETRRLDIKLTPDDLGEIQVRLTRDADGKLSAMMLADRESTRHTLANGVDLLRGALERAGVVVDRLDVNVGAGTGQNAAAGDNGFGSHQEQARSHARDDDYEMHRRPTGSANADDDDRLLSIRA